MRSVLPAAFATGVFHVAPLAILAAAAATGAVAGAGWSDRLAPLPWLVSLAFVGLPHGAADFAISRRAWRGRGLIALWLAYAAAIAVVGVGFMAAPVAVIVAFAVLSCWHFGVSHLAADGRPAGRLDIAAVIARGGIVLAAPLVAWPVETAAAATDLVRLATPHMLEPEPLLAPSAVRTTGLVLAVLTLLACGVEASWAWMRPERRPGLRLMLVDLVVIGSLGLCTHPLFSVGLYFLVWHGWRQMEPLAEMLTGGPPRSWRELVGAVARIHAAALPLLLPTWVAIAAAWWLRSPAHDPRDLAILSIGVYLLVTPAHELLSDLLAAGRCRPESAAQPPA